MVDDPSRGSVGQCSIYRGGGIIKGGGAVGASLASRTVLLQVLPQIISPSEGEG